MPICGETSLQKRSGMAHVVSGSHSLVFISHPHVYPRMKWTIFAFAVQAKIYQLFHNTFIFLNKHYESAKIADHGISFWVFRFAFLLTFEQITHTSFSRQTQGTIPSQTGHPWHRERSVFSTDKDCCCRCCCTANVLCRDRSIRRRPTKLSPSPYHHGHCHRLSSCPHATTTLAVHRHWMYTRNVDAA